MKKFILVLFFALMGACLFAQAANFSSLPSGSWLDSNYNVTWTISASGITVKSDKPDSSVTFTPGDIQGLKPIMSGVFPGVQFSSSTAERTFTFVPSATGTMQLIIEKEGQEKYTVVMQKH